MLSEYLTKKRTVDALIERGRYQEALLLIDELLKRFPLHPELLLAKYRASAFIEEGEPFESLVEKTLEVVAKVCPKFSQSQVDFGYFLFSVLGKNREAREVFESVITQSSKDLILAYTGLLKICLEEGDIQEKRELENIIKEIPNEIFFESGLEVPEA